MEFILGHFEDRKNYVKWVGSFIARCYMRYHKFEILKNIQGVEIKRRKTKVFEVNALDEILK